jgi:F420-dependent oxidoreductase-like protein
MRLSLSVGSLTARSRLADVLAYAQEADRLGYETLWVNEKYGSDAPTLLAWLAAQTTRIQLGSAVMQVPARSAAMTAMTSATLDLVSNGRFVLGLGVSTRQISEGWHSVPFERPLDGIREYVDVVRAVLSGNPVNHEGVHHPVPMRPERNRPMMFNLRHFRRDLPVYLAGVGPRSLQVAGEIADGWLGLFQPPELTDQLANLAIGRKRAQQTMTGFDVVAGVFAVVGDDVAACADRLRATYSSFIGGMGSVERNYYHDHVARMGYRDEAGEVRRLYLAGLGAAAARAVPEAFIDETSLLGPVERITEGIRAYAAAGATSLAITLMPRSVDEGVHTLRVLTEAAARAC